MAIIVTTSWAAVVSNSIFGLREFPKASLIIDSWIVGDHPWKLGDHLERWVSRFQMMGDHPRNDMSSGGLWVTVLGKVGTLEVFMTILGILGDHSWYDGVGHRPGDGG